MSRYVVLADTKSGVTIYSSGILNVGDLHEVIVDIDVESNSGGTPRDSGDGNYRFEYTFTISRLTAFGSLISIADLSASSSYPYAGPAVYPTLAFHSSVQDAGFGDRIQIDLLNPESMDLSFTVSVIGK